MKFLTAIAGEGFKILPTVANTIPTFRFVMFLSALTKVTLLPETEQVKELDATESTVSERQVTPVPKVNTDGKMMITDASEATCMSKAVLQWSYTRFA